MSIFSSIGKVAKSIWSNTIGGGFSNTSQSASANTAYKSTAQTNVSANTKSSQSTQTPALSFPNSYWSPGFEPSYAPNANNFFPSSSNPRATGGTATYGPPAPVSFKAGSGGTSSQPNLSSDAYKFVQLDAPVSFYTAPMTTSTISSGVESLGGSTSPQLSLPSGGVTQTGAIQNTLAANNKALGAKGAENLFVKQEEPTVTEEDPYDKAFREKKEALLPPPSIEEARAKALKDSQIQEAKQRMANTQSSINAITAKMNADLLNTRGMLSREGGTETTYGGIASTIEREAAIRLLPLQAQLATDQGNLQMAEENYNTLFKMYYEDAKNYTDYRNRIVEDNWDLFDKKEQRKLTEQNKAFQFKTDMIKQQVDTFSDMAKEMWKAGDDSAIKYLAANRPPSNIASRDFDNEFAKWTANMQNKFGSTGAGAMTAVASTSTNSLLSAAQNLASKFNTKFSQEQFLNNAKRLAQSGDTQQLADYVFSEAISNISDTESRKKAFGNYRVVKQLAKLESQLSAYEEKGGKTNIFKGTKEDILAKVGVVQDAELRTIGTAITNTLDELARARTGAVISKSEEKMYQKILPGTKKTAELNKAIIDGLKGSLTSDIDNILSFQLTGSGFNSISEYLNYGDNAPQSNPANGATKEWNGKTFKLINGVWTEQ